MGGLLLIGRKYLHHLTPGTGVKIESPGFVLKIRHTHTGSRPKSFLRLEQLERGKKKMEQLL